jgi:5'-nucleotidase
MRVLLTNDDGINAPGLSIMARQLVADRHDVTIVAPLVQCSGSGTSIGSDIDGRSIEVTAVTLPGLEGVPALAVDGPPALAALAACHGLIQVAPQIVVSGINPGNNVGRLAAHSGTLGAVTTAASYGLSGVAVSCAAIPHDQFEATAAFLALALEPLSRHAVRAAAYNLNFPACPLSQVRGVRFGHFATPGPADLHLTPEPGGFRIRLARDRSRAAADSDLALLSEGYISITVLSAGLAESPGSTGLATDLSTALESAQAPSAYPAATLEQ